LELTVFSSSSRRKPGPGDLQRLDEALDPGLRRDDGRVWAGAVLLLAFLFAVPAHAGMCEQPGELYAAELVDAALLSSNLHTVRPCAEVRGHLARFTLDTPYGAIVADSVELLAVRVEELHALEALDERTLAGTAARAAAAEGEAAAKGVARIASNPVDTVKGAPLGAWRFFQRRVAKYAGRAQRLGQRVADESFDRGEAYDSVVARPGVRPVRGEPSPPWWRKTGREVARYARGEVGYGRARRTWSRRPTRRTRCSMRAWIASRGLPSPASRRRASRSAPSRGPRQRCSPRRGA
jgi:hypothetical protein